MNEARMTNDEVMTKHDDKAVASVTEPFRISSFGFPSVFVIRISSFVT
jgi:hypothetical protein